MDFKKFIGHEVDQNPGAEMAYRNFVKVKQKLIKDVYKNSKENNSEDAQYLQMILQTVFFSKNNSPEVNIAISDINNSVKRKVENVLHGKLSQNFEIGQQTYYGTKRNGSTSFDSIMNNKENNKKIMVKTMKTIQNEFNNFLDTAKYSRDENIKAIKSQIKELSNQLKIFLDWYKEAFNNDETYFGKTSYKGQEVVINDTKLQQFLNYANNTKIKNQADFDKFLNGILQMNDYVISNSGKLSSATIAAPVGEFVVQEVYNNLSDFYELLPEAAGEFMERWSSGKSTHTGLIGSGRRGHSSSSISVGALETGIQIDDMVITRTSKDKKIKDSKDSTIIDFGDGTIISLDEKMPDKPFDVSQSKMMKADVKFTFDDGNVSGSSIKNKSGMEQYNPYDKNISDSKLGDILGRQIKGFKPAAFDLYKYVLQIPDKYDERKIVGCALYEAHTMAKISCLLDLVGGFGQGKNSANHYIHIDRNKQRVYVINLWDEILEMIKEKNYTDKVIFKLNYDESLEKQLRNYANIWRYEVFKRKRADRGKIYEGWMENTLRSIRIEAKFQPQEKA